MNGEGDATAEGENGTTPFLKDPWRILGGTLLAVGGLLTFVAAVGGAIIWVRFYAAQLPADQALAAMPRSELVASGAVMLAAFVLLGALAVVGVYMFQGKILTNAPSSPGIVRGLLALATVEIVVVIALAVGTSETRRLLAAEVVVVFSLLILLVIRWRESVIGQRIEPAEDKPLARAVLASWWEGAVGWPAKDEQDDGEDERAGAAALLLAALVTVSVVLTMALEISGGQRVVQILALSATLLCSVLFIGSRWITTGLPGPPDPSWDELPNENDATRTLKRITKLTIFALAFVGVGCAALIMRELWLAIAFVAAIVLATASWRIARRAGYRFAACGIAVFVSVPLLGAVVGVARNMDDPQVQPVALIRTDDGEREALQGIYVTETDDRVYLGTIATEGCSGEIESGSGRLLWVPREDVAAMLLGPPQSVQAAGARALEMYYALAPAAANPYASAESPRADGESGDAPAAKGERRLEDLGPALRRDFNLAAELARSSVKEGESVIVPRTSDEGDPESRTVRVGGAQVDAGEVTWEGDEVELTVPEGAESGPVTVECGDLATEPILRVRRRPSARLVMTLDAGTEEVVLDGTRSTDEGGRITGWRWSFDGRRADSRKLLRRTPVLDDGLYEVGLRAIDDEGDSDSVDVWIGQLPLPRVAMESDATLGEMSDTTLQRLTRELRAGGTLVLHGYSGRGPWTDERVTEEVEGAERELARLLDPKRPRLRSDQPIETRALVLGDGCPPPLRAGAPAVARIDVFVLARGARVRLPSGCKPQEL